MEGGSVSGSGPECESEGGEEERVGSVIMGVMGTDINLRCDWSLCSGVRRTKQNVFFYIFVGVRIQQTEPNMLIPDVRDVRRCIFQAHHQVLYKKGNKYFL